MASAIPLRRIEGKYEILEKIREGGMGAIYKVRHRLLDEVRVIKLMRPQLTEDEELKERFLREARLAIKLRHPNIAQLYDFTVDEESGTAYIVMEFIQGTTLEDLLAVHGPPPLGLALEIAQQSLRALGYLHGKGFIHRDISPDNLMLSEDAEGGPAVKLIDLGIAKILGAPGEKNLTHTGTFLGKVRYASPEQFGSEGAAQVDVRGDLYSFGLVLYELLTRRYPIQGRDPSSIIAGHLFRPPIDFKDSDPGGNVPEGLRAVVLKALAKNPADRYATAQEMSRALAPLRRPDDVSEIDLQRVLSAPAVPIHEEPAPLPGSTQRRLDAQFGLNTTPLPRSLKPVPPETGPGETAFEATEATIELHLQKGSLLEAETELRWAVDAFGNKPELRTLRDRLDGLRQREVELAAEEMIREARQRFAAGDLEEARERLLRARSLDPDHAEVADLLAQIGEAERRHNEEARREREIAEALARIEAALEQGQAAEVEALLFEAEAAHGRQPAFALLYERLEELRRREMQARAAAHLEGVRQLLDAGNLEEAETELQRARRFDPASAAAATLQAALAEARRRQAQAAEVAKHIAAARELAIREDFKAALREIRQAAKVDPAHPEPPVLLAEIEATQKRREEEKRRSERLARAAAAVDKKLQRGDLDAADKLLAEAEAAEGPAPELADRRQKLTAARHVEQERLETLRQAERQELEKKRAAEAAAEAERRRREEERRQQEEERRRLEEKRAAEAAAEAERQRREEERRQQEEERRRQEEKRAAEAAAEAKRQRREEERRQQEEKRRLQEERKREEERQRELQKRLAEKVREDAAPTPAAAVPQPAAGRRPLWIGAAAVSMLAVLLIWWLVRDRAGHEDGQPAQTAREEPVQRPATTAAVPGILIVDAVPWGEVVEILDASGVQQPLGTQRSTPLVLTLPPGRYTLTLRNPHFPQPVSLTAEVLAGTESRSVAEIGRVTEEELFRALGW